MTEPFEVRYYITGPDAPVDPRHPLWRRPLPIHRTDFTGTPHSSTNFKPTYGHYFEAVHTFLRQNSWEALVRGIGGTARISLTPGEIDNVHIHLIKHGEWYHPARIGTQVRGRWHWFVLNVAISKTGKAYAAQEFENLKRLNDAYPLSFIPKVFKFGHGSIGPDAEFPMFLGQWLTGYREFHITHNPASTQAGVAVWDEKGGKVHLSPDHCREVVRQAAMILSFYYHPFTTEHIFPWHHAAGDFVVNTAGGKPKVKLVTVRGYVPLIQWTAADQFQTPDLRNMIDTLTLFFLSTTLRMRMDRMEGVGALSWHDDSLLPAVCRGFKEGLSLAGMIHDLPESFVDGFFRRVKYIGASELIKLCKAYVRKYKLDAPDPPYEGVTEQHLERHGASLFSAVKQME